MTDEEEHEGGHMTLVEHLAELRKRIIISAIAVAVGAIVAFFLYPWIINFLAHPYREITKNKNGCGPSGCSLIATDPLQPFAVRLKVATYGGIVLALPIWLWELWRFVTPGLHRREKKYAIPFIAASIVLFCLGGLVAWLTVPKALQFLASVGGTSITPFFTADKYLSLISLMIIAFGLSFEFPVLLVFLMLAGLLKSKTLSRGRRWWAVGITTFAAIITPSQDPYSLAFMAIPMYLFYEMSILIGKLMKK
jgi:sec-independent protein translocase protein TatC